MCISERFLPLSVAVLMNMSEWEIEKREAKKNNNINSTWGFWQWQWLLDLVENEKLSLRMILRKSLSNSSCLPSFFFFFCEYRLIHVMDYQIAVWMLLLLQEENIRNVISLVFCGYSHCLLFYFIFLQFKLMLLFASRAFQSQFSQKEN